MRPRADPTPARRPTRSVRAGRAGVALGAAGLLVLSSGITTTARWTDTVDVRPTDRIETGRLDLQTQDSRVEVARTGTGATTTTYSSSAGNLPSTLTLGDVITIETTALLRLEGDNLRAEFAVDSTAISQAVGATMPGTFTVTRVSGPELPSSSTTTSTTRSWRVDESHDGATVTVRARFTVPPSRDGAAETGSPNANWWSTTLQGGAVPASTLAITLEQEAV